MLRRVITLDETEMFLSASDDDTLNHIEDLNRRQLMKGKDSQGESLADIGGEYTDATMEISAAEGRPKESKSIVNLHAEGDFHDSITATADRSGYEITSDPIKTDPLNFKTTNLLERYGEDVEGLDEDSIKDLVTNKLTPKCAAYIKKKIEEG